MIVHIFNLITSSVGYFVIIWVKKIQFGTFDLIRTKGFFKLQLI